MTNLNQRPSKNIPPFNEKKNEKTDDMVTNMDEVKLERYLKVTHYLKNNIIIHENRNEINNNNDDKDEEIKKVDVQDNLINIINDLNKKPLLNNKSYLVNGEMIKIDDTSKKKKGKKKCESTGISFVKPRYNDQNGIFENLYNNDVGQEANNNLIEKNPTFVFEQPKKIFNKQDDEVLKIHSEIGHSQKPNPCETCNGF